MYNLNTPFKHCSKNKSLVNRQLEVKSWKHSLFQRMDIDLDYKTDEGDMQIQKKHKTLQEESKEVCSGLLRITSKHGHLEWHCQYKIPLAGSFATKDSWCKRFQGRHVPCWFSVCSCEKVQTHHIQACRFTSTEHFHLGRTMIYKRYHTVSEEVGFVTRVARFSQQNLPSCSTKLAQN